MIAPIYLILIVLTPLFPVLLSFDSKVKYVKVWRFALLSALIVAIPFIIWDELFTRSLIWGFNMDYLAGYHVGTLPIEEVLFFIVVPFACMFIYECVKFYFKRTNLNWINLTFYVSFLIFSIIIGWAGINGWYARIAVGVGLVLLIIVFVKRKQFKFFPIAFLFSMIPFFIVNGILTGSFLSAPIVWYNEAEFSGIRFFTIPAEDIIYAWDMLVLNIVIFDSLLKIRAKSINMRDQIS